MDIDSPEMSTIVTVTMSPTKSGSGSSGPMSAASTTLSEEFGFGDYTPIPSPCPSPAPYTAVTTTTATAPATGAASQGPDEEASRPRLDSVGTSSLAQRRRGRRGVLPSLSLPVAIKNEEDLADDTLTDDQIDDIFELGMSETSSVVLPSPPPSEDGPSMDFSASLPVLAAPPVLRKPINLRRKPKWFNSGELPPMINQEADSSLVEDVLLENFEGAKASPMISRRKSELQLNPARLSTRSSKLSKASLGSKDSGVDMSLPTRAATLPNSSCIAEPMLDSEHFRRWADLISHCPTNSQMSLGLPDGTKTSPNGSPGSSRRSMKRVSRVLKNLVSPFASLLNRRERDAPSQKTSPVQRRGGINRKRSQSFRATIFTDNMDSTLQDPFASVSSTSSVFTRRNSIA